MWEAILRCHFQAELSEVKMPDSFYLTQRMEEMKREDLSYKIKGRETRKKESV